MEVVRFDIKAVPGWPFEATADAREEYGSHAVHPILDRYFDASRPVRWFYWRKFKMIAGLHGISGGRALVAGCGPGVELPTIATGFDLVCAVDLNAADLRIAAAICASQGVANVEIAEADLLGDIFEPGSFDAVYMLDVLEHFPDPAPAVDSVHRLLRRGGSFVVAAPTENRFNDWLRRRMGYSKPSSHFHGSDELERSLSDRFTMRLKMRPLGLPRFLSLTEIFQFVK